VVIEEGIWLMGGMCYEIMHDTSGVFLNVEPPQEFSIVDASGDWEPGQGDIECNSNDGQNRTRFPPTFPASCEGITPIRST
jgi:hypothetical protein